MTAAESDLQAAVSAILERERSEHSPLQTSPNSEFAALSRNLRLQLQPIFTAAGLDTNKIRELLREHQAATMQLLEKSKPKADKSFTVGLRERTNNKRRAMEFVGGKPLIITTLVIDKPFSIYAAPSSMWVNEHIESWNNWAKVLHRDATGTGDSVRVVTLKFFFAWRNPSPDYAAVINVRGEIVAHGSILMSADDHFFDPASASLYIDSRLTAFRAAQYQYLDGETILGTLYTAGHRKQYINAINNLNYNNMIIMPDEQVIFEVGMYAGYGIDEDANVILDFSSGDYQITSVALIVELLTSPTVTANLDAVSPQP